jgi:GT2 family glycosyltransferase
MKKLSCLIPLYRSRRFMEIIRANIDAHLELDAEIIISDRHLLDDTTTILSEIYRGERNVKIIEAKDELNWVDNINILVSACGGEYFRITPHDDTATAESTRRLTEALDRDTSAILAYGVVHACTLHGRPLPDKDHSNATEMPGVSQWNLEDALSLFWMGRYGGSFKGVVRAKMVRKSNLLIKKTPTLIHSERAWLFALALKGPFSFVPDSILIKRYYEDSTHRTWKHTAQTLLDVAATMQEYCTELLEDSALQRQAIFNVLVNAHRRAACFDTHAQAPSPYLSLHETAHLLDVESTNSLAVLADQRRWR